MFLKLTKKHIFQDFQNRVIEIRGGIGIWGQVGLTDQSPSPQSKHRGGATASFTWRSFLGGWSGLKACRLLVHCEPIRRTVIIYHKSSSAGFPGPPTRFLDTLQSYSDFPKTPFDPLPVFQLSIIFFCSTTIGFSFAGTCFSAISFKRADRSGRNLGTKGLVM